MYRFGVNIWSIPRNLRDPYSFMEKAKELGYEGVELAVGEEDLGRDQEALRREWAKVKEHASSLGIDIPSIASSLYWKYNMVLNEDLALRVIEVQCKVASILGARVILVVPGVAVSELDYREHFNRVVKALRKASRIAREYSVVIGLEPVWNRLFPSPLEYEELLNSIGEDNVGVYFDVGNTLPHSLPEHWIGILGKRIVQVHVKDFNMEKLFFGIPGSGSVNWNAVKNALDRVGYNGYLVAEVPWDEKEPYKPLALTLERLRELFG